MFADARSNCRERDCSVCKKVYGEQQRFCPIINPNNIQELDKAAKAIKSYLNGQISMNEKPKVSEEEFIEILINYD